ncbi:hypothetical protein [uncultured Clostridium sp.]|uniref:hypothetical protein n=1 Tax=uncultured Clostridium sp. TaxID=59620 RepID=UPI00261768B6|nr:hypothetical protein [uncultured Clostridium sp.]
MKIRGGYVINIILSVITTICFFYIIKIDNESRLLQNINSDYHMNSLPFIYLVLICLGAITIFNMYKLAMEKGNYELNKKESSQ